MIISIITGDFNRGSFVGSNKFEGQYIVCEIQLQKRFLIEIYLFSKIVMTIFTDTNS